MSYASARSSVAESNGEQGSKVSHPDSSLHADPKKKPLLSKAETVQIARAILFALCFFTSAVCLHVQQWLGVPMYWLNRKWFYAWQAIVKESTALLLFGLNQRIAPCSAKICGDSSVRGQIRKASSGQVQLDFPSRLVLVANHQIYTDWLFLWWSAYTTRHHGHLFIVLKDSLQRIPILGPGMQFFSWVFLSRRWETDRPRFQHRMSHLQDVTLQQAMWLLIFPEGTNLSRNTREMSSVWAKKMHMPDLRHVLLPRTRGLQICLEGLNPSVQWMYDCTIAYEGIPPGEFGQDVYSLKSLYIKSQKAPIAHIHWRRFDANSIPVGDDGAFDHWLYERWAEKDELLEHFQQHGCFPADDGYFESEIRMNSVLEVSQILASALAVLVVWWVMSTVTYGFRALLLSNTQ